MSLRALPEVWQARAVDLAPYAPAAAEAFRRAAGELEAELRAASDEILTLDAAAAESGYSSESLRHLVRDGKVPNAGRRGAPKIRRGDLPKRPTRTSCDYSPANDALSIVRKASGR